MPQQFDLFRRDDALPRGHLVFAVQDRVLEAGAVGDRQAPQVEGLTGAEIESVFNEAMFVAFERGKEPTDLDVAGVLSGFAPLSKLMAEQIAALKSWAVNRARPATSTPDAEERKLRKLGV